MKYVPLFLLAMAAPAAAHGWPSICPDCAAEVCRARAEARLGCAELGPVMEHQRLLLNHQILLRYNRGLVVQPAFPQAVVVPADPEAMKPGTAAPTPRAATSSSPRTDTETHRRDTTPVGNAPARGDTSGDGDLPGALPPAEDGRGASPR
jgi:hypothetical protein